jgi:NAD-dependent dihydropyrimidine dehydrogenase PreA subunit
MMPVLPEIQADRCHRCGRCLQVCPTGALALDEAGIRVLAPDRCDYCGLCETGCPTLAIRCPYGIILARPVAAAREEAAAEDGSETYAIILAPSAAGSLRPPVDRGGRGIRAAARAGPA